MYHLAVACIVQFMYTVLYDPDHRVEKDGALSQNESHDCLNLTEQHQKAPSEVTIITPAHMYPVNGASNPVKTKTRWNRKDSRKGVLVWQMKVKKLKEWCTHEDFSLKSEDFYDAYRRKFKATLYPHGLGNDKGSYMTLSINCLDEVKRSARTIQHIEIIVSVIDPESCQPPVLPIRRQLERRGIRIIPQFISHEQVRGFLCDMIIVTIALTGKLHDLEENDDVTT